jgi:predicted nucleic acid-binding protein
MEENTLEIYYAIFFPLTKEYLIVDNYIEANSHRKGVYNLTEKFETKEKALEWIEKIKNGEIKLLEKKKVYYAVYLKKEKEGMILTDPQEVTKTIYKKTSFCKKFSSEEEGLEWLENIKKDRLVIVNESKSSSSVNNISAKPKKYYAIFFKDTKEKKILTDPEEVNSILYKSSYLCRKFVTEEEAKRWLEIVAEKKQDINPKKIPKELKKKHYAVYFPENRESFITDFFEKVNIAINDEKGVFKGFINEKDAFEWLEQCKTERRICYAIFLVEELKSLIVFDLEMQKNFTKDRANITRIFDTVNEADRWLRNMEQNYIIDMKNLLKEDTIFFDVGTGRGIGAEVCVSDYMGNPIIEKLSEYKNSLNGYGNYNLGKINNIMYGELFGLYLALLISKENNKYKKIAGDNLGVINNWSKGEKISSKISFEEKELIDKVVLLRKEFEENGGEILYINGSINPADLGFHKRKKVNKKMENNN